MKRVLDRTAAAGLAAVMAASAVASNADAAPQTRWHAQAAASNTGIILAHDSWRDGEDWRESRRSRRRHHDRDDVVDAPFTHVEHSRRVVVDAPFAHVTVGRDGRHVVAPLVNLWIPR
jgi:hypothetical protein